MRVIPAFRSTTQSDYGIETLGGPPASVVCASALRAVGRGEVIEHLLSDLFFWRGVRLAILRAVALVYATFQCRSTLRFA